MFFGGKYARIPRGLGCWLVFAAFVMWEGGATRAQTAAQIPVESFAKLPTVSQLSISPDGEYLAMLRPLQGRNVLVIEKSRKGPEDKPVVIPAEEPFFIAWVRWANNDRVLVSLAFAGIRDLVPTRETRLLAINKDGSGSKDIVKPDTAPPVGTRVGGSLINAQIQDDVIDILPDDAEHILLALDSDRNGEYEVRNVNIVTGAYHNITNDFRGIQNWYIDQQGELRYATGAYLSTYLRRYRIPETGKWSDFEQTDAFKHGFQFAGFDSDPHQMFMTATSDYGTEALVRYDLSEDRIDRLLFNNKKYSLGGLLRDDRTRRIMGYWYIEDVVRFVYFDEAWNRRQATIDRALPNTSNEIVSSTQDGKIHIIRSTSDVDSGMYYVYDEGQKRINPVTPLFPELDPALMSPMRTIAYEARDGLEIPAYITVPKDGDGPFPAVVMPHGGPHTRDSKSFDYWTQFLASRGYAVLQPNFRGSSGYTRDFENAGTHNWGLAMQDDVTDGVKWMIGEGIADPDRICILGISYGGYAALMGAVKTPELYQCSVSINGVTDLLRLIRESERYIGGRIWTKSIGDRREDEDQLKATSPYHQVDKISVPVLLIQAEDDRTVPKRHAESMASALRKADKQYKFIEIESGDHSLMTEQSRLIALREVEAFLAENLQAKR